MEENSVKVRRAFKELVAGRETGWQLGNFTINTVVTKDIQVNTDSLLETRTVGIICDY